MKKIAVLLAEGFEEVEAVTPIDFLRRAGITVLTAGIDSLTVRGSHDITLTADVLIDNLPGDLDGIVIPGGMPGAANIAASKKALDLIDRLFEKGKLIAAICAAPAVVLGKTEILNGKHFTCYPGNENKVSGAVFSENRVVTDGNIITSRGPGTAAEFSLAVIRYFSGDEAADRIDRGTLQK